MTWVQKLEKDASQLSVVYVLKPLEQKKYIVKQSSKQFRKAQSRIVIITFYFCLVAVGCVSLEEELMSRRKATLTTGWKETQFFG